MCWMQILFPGSVNSPGKRAIVSSTIAATFISILRNHDRQRRGESRTGTTGEPRQSQHRKCGDAWFLYRAGGGGNLVACYHGGSTKGSGLRRPGTPQLFNDRDSRPSAIGAFSVNGRSKMRKLLTTMLVTTVALIILVAGPAAIAQTGSNTGSSGVANQPRPMIPEAPIGHRQPRADQVPSEKNLADPNDPLSKENAALDRKIKSICRGC